MRPASPFRADSLDKGQKNKLTEGRKPVYRETKEFGFKEETEGGAV